jgi:hypothetical protein
MEITTYEHHGIQVKVRTDLKGRHREFCLCYHCAKLNTEDRPNNCPIANELLAFDIKNGVVCPVFECPVFEEKKE